MADELRGMKIAFLVAPEGVEQVELTEPWRAVEQAGGLPGLISTQSGRVQAFHHLDKGDAFTADSTVNVASPADFDALVLPGGVANPDYLRTQPEAVAFARAFFDAGKPVAAICHAPWLLIDVDIVSGRTLTSWPSLKTDLRNAGATWVDTEVTVCDAAPSRLITSRGPDDLKAFNQKIVEEFAPR